MVEQSFVFEPSEGAGTVNLFLPKRNANAVEKIGDKTRSGRRYPKARQDQIALAG
jgi:hypothetical protein